MSKNQFEISDGLANIDGRKYLESKLPNGLTASQVDKSIEFLSGVPATLENDLAVQSQDYFNNNHDVNEVQASVQWNERMGFETLVTRDGEHVKSFSTVNMITPNIDSVRNKIYENVHLSVGEKTE